MSKYKEYWHIIINTAPYFWNAWPIAFFTWILIQVWFHGGVYIIEPDRPHLLNEIISGCFLVVMNLTMLVRNMWRLSKPKEVKK